MDQKDVRVAGLFFVVLGLLLLSIMLVSDNPRERPVFDGDLGQLFSLRLLEYDETVNANSVLNARLEIHNSGEAGSMFVECGLYDRNTAEGSWIGRSAVVDVLPEIRNCVMNQPYVQTAKVYLMKGEKTMINMELNVPYKYVDEDVVLYCGTFERCYVPGVDTYQSDSLFRSVSVIDEPLMGEENETVVDNSEVVVEDPDDIRGFNERFKEWLFANSFAVFFVSVLLLGVGAYFVYNSPVKKKKEFFR